MDTLKKLVNTALDAIAMAARTTVRVVGVAAPAAVRIVGVAGRTAGRLVDAIRGTDVKAKAEEARKAAKRGQRTATKFAKEVQDRRTGRKRRRDRARRFGIVGAVATGVIAIILYVPRKLMGQTQEIEPRTGPGSTMPAAGTSSDPATPAAETPGNQQAGPNGTEAAAQPPRSA